LAALSPCVAKINEFADTGDLVSYNVTFVKLEEYIRKNKLALPEKESGFDHVDSGLGSIFPMPGGLRENVEFMLGQPMRIDKSEGQGVVYHSLDAFAREAEKGGENLPALFDVLNCPEGCNLGTACHHDRSPFEVDATMDKARCQAMKGRNRDYFDELYETYDKTFRLADFLRRYRPRPVRSIPVSDEVIEKAFQQMNKMDEASRTFDCGACGSDSCREMAIKVAKKINYADYCIQAIRTEIEEKQVLLLDLHRDNAESMQVIQNDIVSIKKLADDIVNSLVNVTTSFDVYESVTKGIDKIASNIHMISLNASIEAARAGEHGRSFAVVAEAIRDLASETQNATMKITATSADARKAVDGIAGRIVTIGGDITQAHDDISTIAEKTQKILHVDD
jgi:uncharacterized coiled-coil DUF342 family protein